MYTSAQMPHATLSEKNTAYAHPRAASSASSDTSSIFVGADASGAAAAASTAVSAVASEAIEWSLNLPHNPDDAISRSDKSASLSPAWTI